MSTKEEYLDMLFNMINNAIYTGACKENSKGEMLKSILNACKENEEDEEVMKRLFIKTDSNQNTLLHNAIYQQPSLCCSDCYWKLNNPIFLKILLKELKEIIKDIDIRKSIIDARGILNYPPLLLASLKGSFEMINLLKDYGANMNIRSTEGDTVLHALAIVSTGSIIHDDEKYGFFAIEDDDKYQSLVNYLISQGVDPAIENIDGINFYNYYIEMKKIVKNINDGNPPILEID